VYDLNLVRALNGLAYLKSFDAHQKELIKKERENAQNSINGQ
jgi:hypothetical protein